MVKLVATEVRGIKQSSLESKSPECLVMSRARRRAAHISSTVSAQMGAKLSFVTCRGCSRSVLAIICYGLRQDVREVVGS